MNHPSLFTLIEINNAWLVNADYENSAHPRTPHDEVESDGSSDTSVDRTHLVQGNPHIDQDRSSSAAYAEFLAFLSLGCNGSPVHGYPTLIVILSTIPGKAREQLPVSVLLYLDFLLLRS